MSRKERRAQAEKETATGRLDRWLWFARLAKSRSLAAQVCASGAVALNGVTVRKAAHQVRPGDEIVLRRGAYRVRLRVIGLGLRRGPAAEARALYEEKASAQRVLEKKREWETLLDEEEEGTFEQRPRYRPAAARRALSTRSAAK